MHAIDPIQIHRSPTLQADGRHQGPKRRLKDRTKVPADNDGEKHPIVEVVNEGLRIISITCQSKKF